ncbi:MAG: hypothetical protein ALECFALPRED_006233 [Alectoria fallacina]|uniref:F-box domain-containing protein n=1 Tax=Alectoria fallacina TaxID=1903189 RepID=A0A8H3G5B4_9LECA|nr:MAG: hypothetical protein ALECFALPRED_006233 [Alectoria fallacina]
MNQLSLELIRFIVEEVPGEDLENLRLVNKIFADLAAPRLFEAIPVWIGIRSLERLTALSEHPQLSRYPKEIIFSPLRFIDYKDDKVYRAQVQEWFEYQPYSLSSHALAIGRHMSAYRSYIEAQRYLSSKATDVKILSRAFTRLPNLETLRLAYANLAIGSLEMVDAFGRFVARDLVTFDCEYALPTLFRALFCSRTKFKIFKLGPDGDYAHGGDLSEAVRVRSSLVPLSHAELPSCASTSTPDRIIVDALSKTFLSPNVEICKGALSQLRELRIGKIFFCGSEVPELSRVTTAIRMMIKSAPDIETIVIHIFGLFYEMPKPSLTATIPESPLGNLRVLEVSDHETKLPALTRFFRHHQESLVKVKFSGVNIGSSDWSTALVHLRTINFACLELFTLTCCDGQEEELEVQDYISKKTDEDPLVVFKKHFNTE